MKRREGKKTSPPLRLFIPASPPFLLSALASSFFAAAPPLSTQELPRSPFFSLPPFALFSLRFAVQSGGGFRVRGTNRKGTGEREMNQGSGVEEGMGAILPLYYTFLSLSVPFPGAMSSRHQQPRLFPSLPPPRWK